MDMSHDNRKAQVGEAASDLLHEGKKWANELREEGLHKVNQVEEHLKESSDLVLQKVQENPLAAVLIAGGVGFLLSKILSK